MGASKFDIEKIRKKMAQKVEGRKSDPFEFRPPKAKKDEVLKYRFFVLPDLTKGDKVYGGLASRDMDLFVVKHGQHWINNRPHACPRLYNEEECDLCQIGFDALNEIPKNEKEKRQAVIKQWLSSSVFAANLYFPPIDPNPEEVRGKVLWFNAPKQVFDIWYAALNRDDAGDPDDPEAFGVFYDPFNAFQFQLVVKPSGSYNDYKSSKFIAGAGSHPIVTMAGSKKPDEAAIQKILDSRHDLWTKIDVPNPSNIHKLAQTMLHGGDAAADEGGIPATTPEDVEGKGKATSEGKKPGKTLPDVPAGDDDDTPPAKPAKAAAPAAKPKPAPAPAPADDEDAAQGTGDLADETPPAPKAKAAAAPAAKAPAAKPAAAAAPAAKPKPAPAPAPADDDDDDDADDINDILKGLKKGEDDDDDTATPPPDEE